MTFYGALVRRDERASDLDAGPTGERARSIWMVVGNTAYVRNARGWVLGVLLRGDVVVAGAAGVWVTGRATDTSQGYRGWGRVLVFDSKRGRRALRRVEETRATAGAVEAPPELVEAYRYVRRSARGVRTSMLGDASMYARHILTGATVGRARAGEAVEVSYVTADAAMIRRGDQWGFVARRAVQLPPPVEAKDPYAVLRGGA